MRVRRKCGFRLDAHCNMGLNIQDAQRETKLSSTSTWEVPTCIHSEDPPPCTSGIIVLYEDPKIVFIFPYSPNLKP